MLRLRNLMPFRRRKHIEPNSGITINTYTSVSDSASIIDALLLYSIISILDSGSNDDSIVTSMEEFLKNVSDSGIGTDSIIIRNLLQINDTATDIETLIMTVRSFVSDYLFAVEDKTINVFAPINESGGHTEIIQVIVNVTITQSAIAIDTSDIHVNFNLNDSGHSVEQLSGVLTGVLKSIIDSGMGNEDIVINISFSLSENFNYIENVPIYNPITILDNGSHSDNILSSVFIGIVDAANALENQQIEVNLPLNEAINILDFLSNLTNIVSLIENANGSEIIYHFDSSTKIVKMVFRPIHRDMKFTIKQRDITYNVMERKMISEILTRKINFTLTTRDLDFKRYI